MKFFLNDHDFLFQKSLCATCTDFRTNTSADTHWSFAQMPWSSYRRCHNFESIIAKYGFGTTDHWLNFNQYPCSGACHNRGTPSLIVSRQKTRLDQVCTLILQITPFEIPSPAPYWGFSLRVYYALYLNN